MSLFSRIRPTITETETPATVSRLTVGAWFYQQDGVELSGLTDDGLAALVRFGYVKSDALVGSIEHSAKPLTAFAQFSSLQHSPFSALPTLEKPAPEPEYVAPTFDAPPSLVTRFASLMVDLTVIMGITIVTSFITVPLLAKLSFVGAVAATWLTCATLYFGLSESNAHGATLGKRLFRLQVVTEKHQPVGLLRGLWRGALKTLSAVVLPISGVIALSAKDKRALHDRLAQTRVVRIK